MNPWLRRVLFVLLGAVLCPGVPAQAGSVETAGLGFSERLACRLEIDEPEPIPLEAKVVLLGQTVARTLFGEADPVGETVRIRRVPHTVIGVLDQVVSA